MAFTRPPRVAVRARLKLQTPEHRARVPALGNPNRSSGSPASLATGRGRQAASRTPVCGAGLDAGRAPSAGPRFGRPSRLLRQNNRRVWPAGAVRRGPSAPHIRRRAELLVSLIGSATRPCRSYRTGFPDATDGRAAQCSRSPEQPSASEHRCSTARRHRHRGRRQTRPSPAPRQAAPGKACRVSRGGYGGGDARCVR